MRSLGRALLLGLVAALLAPSPLVAATLVDRGSVTRDPATGLDWLDVDRTTGLSYVDVVNGVGNDWVEKGWRHATTTEVCGLFAGHAGGVPDPCPRFDSIELEAGENEPLIDVLGATYNAPNGPSTLGLYDAETPDRLSEGIAGLDASSFQRDYTFVREPWVLRDHRDEDIGHYLVRPSPAAAIPEPSSALAFGAGFALVGARLRRRTRSARRLDGLDGASGR